MDTHFLQCCSITGSLERGGVAGGILGEQHWKSTQSGSVPKSDSMSLYDLLWASYKFHAFTYAFLKWIQFKMLNKDTGKLHQFFCFRVRGFFSVKLRLDTNRNFALGGTLPTCTQPAPILIPSLQLPSCSTLWDLPIYFLFTVRATYCNNLPKNQREVLDCCSAYSLFFLPSNSSTGLCTARAAHGARITLGIHWPQTTCKLLPSNNAQTEGSGECFPWGRNNTHL